jgi:MFS family permease
MRRRPPINLNNLLATLFVTTWNVTLPLVPVYVAAQGARPFIIGLIVSSNTLMPLLLALPMGIAADRLSTRWITRISAAVMVASYVLVVASESLELLVVALTAVGVADVGLIVAAQTYVAKMSTDRDRDRNFSQFAAWVSVGSLIGPILGGVLADQWGFRAAFWCSLSLAAVVFALSWLLAAPKPPHGTAAEMAHADAPSLRDVGALVRDPGVGFVLLTSGLLIVATSVRHSFFPLYLKTLGMSTTLIGVILSCYSLFQIAARPVMEHAIRRLRHVGVLAAALATVITGIAVTPWLSSFWPLVFAFSLVGVGTGFTQPLTMSLISGRATAGTRGLAIGLRQVVNQIAQITGPPLLGMVAGLLGLRAVFHVAAVIAAFGFVWLLRLARVRS